VTAFGYSEDALVEQPAIALFAELGWEMVNGYHETFGPTGTFGRETTAEVVLVARLRPALRRLNPGLPAEAVDLTIQESTRDRGAMSPSLPLGVCGSHLGFGLGQR
jgi:type I restriction enzyme, R subunit